jgi:hypothetical protein
MREHLDRVEATWREWGAPDSAAGVRSRRKRPRST